MKISNEINRDDLQQVIQTGNVIWEQWAAMWNGNMSLASQIIEDGVKVHLTATSKDDPDLLKNAKDIEQWVSKIRAGYTALSYVTLAGPFVDVQQQVITAHWEANIVFGGLTDSPFDIKGRVFKLAGTDILKFRNNKIYECWTLNNPSRQDRL